MRLKFLQADEDIGEFVAYLYEQGYALTHGCRKMRDIVMDPVTAVYELRHDLHRGFGVYYIVDAAGTRILAMVSCCAQSHPSKLGRQGRSAGVIGHIDKENEREKELMRQLRSYFRKHYKFLRYNGGARMSCHFGPHYQQTEAAFFADPRTEDLCTGHLCLVCPAGRAELEQERAVHALNQLDTQNIRVTLRPYWPNPALAQLDIPFEYFAPSFSEKAYSAVFSPLSYDGKIRFGTGSNTCFFRNRLTPDNLADQAEANCIDLLLQKSWGEWKL